MTPGLRQALGELLGYITLGHAVFTVYDTLTGMARERADAARRADQVNASAGERDASQDPETTAETTAEPAP